MKIRKAKTSDINGCLRLEKLDKGKYWSKKDFNLAIKDKNTIFLVAEEKEIIGYTLGFTCPTKKTDVMLHETRTSRRLRKRKIGTSLVNEFCKLAFKKGARNIYALIEKELTPFYVKSCKFKKSQNWLEVKKSK